jgi:hypothetical protein
MDKHRFLEAIRNGAVNPWPVYPGGKESSSPDYTSAAIQQGLASKEVTNMQTWANRPQINTPWGQQTWQSQATTDPATGQPVTSWQTDINLTPEQQQALDAQQRIGAGRSAGAETLLGQATQAFQTPFRWGAMPGVPGSVGEAQQGAYGKLSAMLQPGRMQQEESLKTRLSNMGLHEGSEAWNREHARLADQFATQDKQMLAQAMAEGRSDVTTQGMLRKEAVAEEAMRRGMTLNELNALLTGTQVGYPQGMAGAPNATAAAAQPTQYLSAANMAGQNQDQGSDWGSAIGGIASLAGTAMTF